MFSDKALKSMIFPLIIEQTLVMLVGMADTLMVSQVGETAVSGVTLVDMFEMMTITVLTSVCAGGGVVISQYIGRRDGKNARLSSSQLMTMTALVSFVLAAVCFLFHYRIMKVFYGSAEKDVIAAADAYLKITAPSFFFIGIYNAAAAVFRAVGKTSVTMYVSLIMNVINIGGNALGIFVFKAGIAGVAVPTLISRAFSGIVMTALAFSRKNEIYITLREIFSWKAKTLKTILNIAIPNGIENGLFALGKVLVTSIVAGFGKTQITANGVTNSIQQFAVLVIVAVNPAIITVIGQCAGAKRFDEAEKYVKKFLKLSYTSVAAIGTAICLAMPLILRFYNISYEAKKYVFILVLIHNVFAMLMHPIAFNMPNVLRAAGDAKFTMYVGIISMGVFRIGMALVLGKVLGFGVIGVWFAMIIDWVARSVCFIARYRSGKWKTIKVI